MLKRPERMAGIAEAEIRVRLFSDNFDICLDIYFPA